MLLRHMHRGQNQIKCMERMVNNLRIIYCRRRYPRYISGPELYIITIQIYETMQLLWPIVISTDKTKTMVTEKTIETPFSTCISTQGKVVEQVMQFYRLTNAMVCMQR